MDQELRGFRVVGRADESTATDAASLHRQPLNAFTLLSRDSAAAISRLRQALDEHDPSALDGLLHHAARLVARDAHRHGLTAAQMIIAARGAWTALNEPHSPTMDDDVSALASRMISFAIEAYYLPESTAGREPGVAAETQPGV